MSALTLERKVQHDPPPITTGGGIIMITPPLDEDFWSYRVELTETQAILGFPKFGVVGIGFAEEEDWNTNLPSSADTEEILEHIGHNRGDDTITDKEILEAIELIQIAIKADKETP